VRELRLPLYRKARIWLGDLPDWSAAVIKTVEYRSNAPRSHFSQLRSAAVEALIPTGGRALYGGLGATFVPKDTGQLCIRISIAADQGELLPDSLAGSLDTVYKGLLEEYVPGIYNTIARSDLPSALGAGTLHFCRAAHGRIGSAIVVFERLSSIVIQLLCLEQTSASEEELTQLIQQQLRWSRIP
jgi:hypothetical protein